MEECESLDSEITELQGFQCEASEAISQDDEDEVEELHNRCFTYWILKQKSLNCRSPSICTKWLYILLGDLVIKIY